MKYFLIAGEASGDLLGASLMEGIIAKDPQAEFNFWGGDEMSKKSTGLLQHYRDIAIMGFVEVLMKIRTIKGNLERCKQQITSYQPDVLILIDFPGFNMRMAEFAKKSGIKTCYYIAPKIWAWNEKRGFKLEKYIDLLLLIFPFEIEYFEKWKVNSLYIGNPLFNQTQAFIPDASFREKNKLNQKPIIGLLPGSRKQEIKRMLPKMVLLAAKYPQYQFIIAGSPGLTADFYTSYLSENVKLIFHATRDILTHSEAALVCSGTASLETAFMKVPHVVAYAAQPLTYLIASGFVKVKYASIMNISFDREAVRELIQHHFTLENLQLEFEAVLPGGSKQQKLLDDYELLHQLFSKKNASEVGAEAIINMIKS